MKPFRYAAMLAGAAIALGGCMDRDPYRRTDVWRPTGANAANIAAQVADPADLIRGRGTQRVDTAASTIAIDRVRTDTPRPINPAARQSGGASQAGSPGGGAGGGGGSGTGDGISLAPPGS